MAFDIGSPIPELVAKYKLIAPETSSESNIWKAVCDCKGNDGQIQEMIGSWWVTTMEGGGSNNNRKPPPASSDRPTRGTRPLPRPASRNRSTSRDSRDTAPSVPPSPSAASTDSTTTTVDSKRDKKEKKEKKEKSEKKKKKPPPGRKVSMKSNASQVRLLAEHCFTLSDDAVASLVKYRIPSQSRWDFKQKLHVSVLSCPPSWNYSALTQEHKASHKLHSQVLLLMPLRLAIETIPNTHTQHFRA